MGSHLVTHFISKGWRVIALVRRPEAHAKRKGVTYRAFDIAKPINPGILEGTDYLVHAAYVKQTASEQQALRLNTQAAQQLLAASRQAGLRKNVFISSMSAHEAAESVYGRQKLAIEHLFDAKKDISLRPGLIIGNGGIVKQMVGFMRSKHLVPLVGGGNQPLQSIAVSDLVTCVDKALTGKVNGVVTVAHPTVFSYKTFYKTIAQVFSIRIFFVPVPLWMLLFVARCIRVLHLPLGFTEENVLGLKQLRSVDTRQDLADLGVEVLPLTEALYASGLAGSAPAERSKT